MKKWLKNQRVKLNKSFTRKRKMPTKKALLTVCVMYALFGAYSLVILIQSNGKDALKELFVSTTVIEIAEAKKISTVEPKKEIEVVDCYTAVDFWEEKYGNAELLKKIIKAESGNNPKAKNGQSTARGCAQWIIGSWESYGKRHWGEDFYNKNVYNPKDNVELMAWAVALEGTSPWNASKSVWGQ